MKRIVTPFKMLCFVMLILLSAKTFSQNLSSEEALKLKLAQYAAQTGISGAYLQQAHIASSYTDAKTGIQHIYLQQSYKGIDVYNQLASIAFKDDQLVYTSGKFVKAIEKKTGTVTPTVTALDAVLKAAAHLKLPAVIKFLEVKSNSMTVDNKVIFSAAGIAKRDIEAKLYWAADSLGSLHLAWNVNIDVLNKPDWWNVQVDALTGNIIKKDNWTTYEAKSSAGTKKGSAIANATASASGFANNKFFLPPTAVTSASYFAIPYPADNRNVTPFTLITNPWENAGAGNNATTYGWQYDGATDYSITRGNNIYAYDDSANINKPGRPAKSVTPLPNLKFMAQPNFNKQPSDSINRTAAVINLFYWNNIMHDVMYQYGFNEASGNFQADNMLRGGKGNDYVLAEAQDGSGNNNANFNTPADGSSGRMQMYLWSAVSNLTITAPQSVAGTYTNIESVFSPFNKLASVGPVTGRVVYYNRTDTTACTALPGTDASLKGRIALIYRGTCPFTVKVKNAQNAGAIAAIIVNNQGAPIAMGGTDSTITIPAVMISTDDGAIISAPIRAGDSVSATLSNNGILLDGDLDNGIICHEYGHGISNRLTGGPTNTSCLSNAEQAGEGWSDYVGLIMTTNWSTEALTSGATPRGVGTYAYGEGYTGVGIRQYPYSTDMKVNPLTYANMATNTEVHAIGEIWCATLWDMTWNIIQQEGKIEGNLYNAASTAGNTIALQLVMEGMKLQPCGPGYLDSRNAILAADSILYGYRHKCAIWNAFARRGMGVSAIQGSANNATDQVAAFDVPGVVLAKATEPIIAKGQFTENLLATCGCTIPTGNYTLTDTIPKSFQYVSSTGGSITDSVVKFTVNFTAPLQEKAFSVTLQPTGGGCNIDSVVNDDRDGHTKGGFASGILNGSTNWTVSTTKSYSPTHAWFAADADTLTQFVLTSDAFVPKGLSTLSFWHYVNTEYGYDGGVVEIQVNNGTWKDARPYFTKNGYNGIIDQANASLPKIAAFTGLPFTTFNQSLVNLSSLTDSTLKLRFRMRSDSAAHVEGWYVDNISVANGCGAFHKIGLYDGGATLVQSYSIPVYNTSSVLPLTLINFTATAQGTSAVLQWQTASEINTKEFVVEVSKDGNTFSAIGTVIAKGESTNTYVLNDANPYNGLNYYRVKMVDQTGSFTYSPVRTVLFTNKGLLVVKPNPAVNSTTIYFDKDLKLYYLTISDMQGKILKQVSLKNTSSTYTINTANLAAGTYLIKAFPLTGTPITVKLVVNH